MVDHPDFCSERELEKAKATMPLQLLRDRAEDDDEEDSVQNENDDRSSKKKDSSSTAAQVREDENALARFNPSMQRRSLSSIRAGVTVASKIHLHFLPAIASCSCVFFLSKSLLFIFLVID